MMTVSATKTKTISFPYMKEGVNGVGVISMKMYEEYWLTTDDEVRCVPIVRLDEPLVHLQCLQIGDHRVCP